MARTASYMAHGNTVACIFGRPLTLGEARRRMESHVASLTSGLAITSPDATLVMIGELAVAIREAEAFEPANDGSSDPNPPAACAAIPQQMEAA
jgi:hypothetical protein